VDYQGAVSPVSVRGYAGFFLFKDVFSGFRHAVFVKDKSGDSFLKAAEEVIAFYRLHGHIVRQIRCDAGSSENDSTRSRSQGSTSDHHASSSTRSSTSESS